MKRFLAIVPALFFAAQALAAGKPCDELRSEIAAKIEANGVKEYTLDVLPADQEVTDKKVVGTCEGGTRKIVYARK